MRRRLAIVLSHPIQHFCPLYAAWARSSDWDIHVFFGSRAGSVPYEDANFGKTISWGGLGLDRFTHTFVNGDAAPVVSSALDAPGLDRELRAFAPHALLTYGYDQQLQRRAQAWARRHRVPLLFFSDGELRHRRPIWKSALKSLVVRWIFGRIDWFIVTGNANEEYYRHYGVRPSRMIRGSYPIDRQTYRDAYARRAALRQETRRRLGLHDDECVVAMVGKLVAWKRQGDLLAAVARMTSGHAAALVIGTGPKESEWQANSPSDATHRFIFTGFVPAEQLPELYAAADVYVHASEKEPHSVAVSEAIYMGLPVVISDRCGSYGMDDDVRTGVNGFVYPCGDVACLASRLDWLNSNPAARHAMGQASHHIGARQQDVIYDEVLATLGTLLNSLDDGRLERSPPL
jgi:glycosyltransferase involved in cell wall biosynthesis